LPGIARNLAVSELVTFNRQTRQLMLLETTALQAKDLTHTYFEGPAYLQYLPTSISVGNRRS